MNCLDTQALQEKHDLTAHVPCARDADRVVGLRGKHVLEVGGTLPKAFVLEELGAARWVGIEHPGYGHGIGRTRDAAGRLTFEQAQDGAKLGDHAVLSGPIEQLPEVLRGQFDAVFSVATFERIDRLPLALAAMYAALKPGGRLFSAFAPIWSAHDGHHLEDITDRSGRMFTRQSPPIPPWGHLLATPPELHRQLLARTDAETAAEIVFQVYRSNAINRLFFEDYVRYFKRSPFRIDTLTGTFPAQVPEAIERRLLELHPRNRSFAHGGLLAVLSRPTLS